MGKKNKAALQKKTCRLHASWQYCWKANCQCFRRLERAINTGSPHSQVAADVSASIKQQSTRRRCGKTSGKRTNGGEEHPFNFFNFVFWTELWSRFKHFRHPEFRKLGKLQLQLPPTRIRKKTRLLSNIEVIRLAFCLRLSWLWFILAACGCLHTSVCVSEILRALRWHEASSL